MIKKLLSLFTRREKKRGAIVLMMAVGMAVLETAGVASVMPFLSVLGNPGIVETNPVLATAYEWGGFESVDAFLMALGVGAFALIVTSAIFRAVTLLPIFTRCARGLFTDEDLAQIARCSTRPRQAGWCAGHLLLLGQRITVLLAVCLCQKCRR